MKKRYLLGLLAAIVIPSASIATTKPMMTFSVGSDRARVYSTKYITLIAPFQNAYIGTNHYDTEPVIGLFLGAETALLQDWRCQWGLSYFQSSAFVENGNVYQFSNPAFNNLNYQYAIQSRRVLLEAKLSRVFMQTWYPYFSIGMGEAINKAYAYIESPVTSADVPMTQAFSSHTTQSFTYLRGIGLDKEIDKHIRIGAGYRFLNLGSASLGTTPLQSSTNTISNSHIYTNEFLVQLTVVG